MRFFIEDRKVEHKDKETENFCNIYRRHVLSLNGISNFEFGGTNENENHFSVPDYVKELNRTTME